VTSGLLLALADDVLDLLAHGVEGDVQRLKSFRCHSLTLVDETEQNVLGANVVVIEHLGFFLRQDNDAASAVGKSLKHVNSHQHTGGAGLELRVTLSTRKNCPCSPTA
jgi:hypothetical protein